MFADDRAGLGRQRGVARHGGRRDLRRVPGLVRDDVLRPLHRAAGRPLLPDHPRDLVRVALEEHEPALAEGVALGERGRQLRRLADLGRRASRTCSTACRSTRAATSPGRSGTCSTGTRVLGGARGRGDLRLPRGDLPHAAHARRPARARGPRRRSSSRCSRRSLGAAFLILTVVVAVDRNDKNVFPPVLPAAIGIAALVLAVVFVHLRRQVWAFTMTGLGTIAVVVTLFTSLFPRVMVSSTDFANSLTVSGSASQHYTLAGDERRRADLRPARPALPGLDVPRVPGTGRRRASPRTRL